MLKIYKEKEPPDMWSVHLAVGYKQVLYSELFDSEGAADAAIELIRGALYLIEREKSYVVEAGRLYD